MMESGGEKSRQKFGARRPEQQQRRMNDSRRREARTNNTQECKHEIEKARGVLAKLPRQAKQHVSRRENQAHYRQCLIKV